MMSAEGGTGIMNLFNRKESKKKFHPNEILQLFTQYVRGREVDKNQASAEGFRYYKFWEKYFTLSWLAD
jgi:hypothetical protein